MDVSVTYFNLRRHAYLFELFMGHNTKYAHNYSPSKNGATFVP